jgi:hypothetical protein
LEHLIAVAGARGLRAMVGLVLAEFG